MFSEPQFIALFRLAKEILHTHTQTWAHNGEATALSVWKAIEVLAATLLVLRCCSIVRNPPQQHQQQQQQRSFLFTTSCVSALITIYFQQYVGLLCSPGHKARPPRTTLLREMLVYYTSFCCVRAFIEDIIINGVSVLIRYSWNWTLYKWSNRLS